MPNWISNYMSVKGKKNRPNKSYDDELVRFVMENFSGKDLDLNKSVPMPKDFVATISNEEGRKALAERDLASLKAKLKETTGYASWDEWRIAYWGVSRNTAEKEGKAASKKLITQADENSEIDVCFDTANSVPTNWLKYVAVKYPGLKFDIRFEDAPNGLFGKILASGTDFVIEEDTEAKYDFYENLVEMKPGTKEYEEAIKVLENK